MISLVILTWNAIGKTIKCLDSLFETDACVGNEIIVVDNASTDGTVVFLEGLALKNKITLIKNKKNLGYSKAVNIGIKAANANSDILLLNNDTELLSNDWLSRMFNAAYSKSDIGVLGVKILRSDLTLQHCGAYMPQETMKGQQICGGETDINQFNGLHEVESVVFACALIKRDTINAVGLLSEDFFAYYEDSDYCDRVRKSKLKVFMLGDVKILHHENSSTKENGANFNDIYEKSRMTYINKWERELRAFRYCDILDWYSIINFPSGYATSAREILLALESDAIINGSGVNSRYKYVYGKGTPFPVEEMDHTDSYILNCIKQREFGKAETQVIYAQGDVFLKNTGKRKIGFTMLETDRIPEEWVRQANMMDEVWVPSTFNKKSFITSGVKTDIKVVPLGINEKYFNPHIVGKRFSDKFTFFSVFEWGERKAPDVLLKAFSDEFSIDENVCLVCKINNFDPSVNIHQEIAKLNLSVNSAQIIILNNFLVKGYEMAVLYRSVDAFVLPTRGEGWGMPILEAMACGLPVIATNWSAQTDFLNSNNGFPLEVEQLIPAEAKCPYYKGFKWAQPSYEHLRSLLRNLYSNQELSSTIGFEASKFAHEYFTWTNTTKIIKNLINV